jgi:hypothetical protein
VGANPNMTYGVALREVFEKFQEESYIGTSQNVHPFIDQATKKKMLVVFSKAVEVKLFELCSFLKFWFELFWSLNRFAFVCAS